MEADKLPITFNSLCLSDYMYIALTVKGIKHFLKTKNKHVPKQFHIPMEKPVFDNYYKMTFKDFIDVFNNLDVTAKLYYEPEIFFHKDAEEKYFDKVTSDNVVFEHKEKRKHLSFGEAISAARRGEKIAREGWENKTTFLYLVNAGLFTALAGVAKKHWGGNPVPYKEYWAFKNEYDQVETWSPTGSDSLANDWKIIK